MTTYSFDTDVAALASRADAAAATFGYSFTPGTAGRGAWVDLAGTASAKRQLSGAILIAADGTFGAVPVDGTIIHSGKIKVQCDGADATAITFADFKSKFTHVWPSVLGACGL